MLCPHSAIGVVNPDGAALAAGGFAAAGWDAAGFAVAGAAGVCAPGAAAASTTASASRTDDLPDMRINNSSEVDRSTTSAVVPRTRVRPAVITRLPAVRPSATRARRTSVYRSCTPGGQRRRPDGEQVRVVVGRP